MHDPDLRRTIGRRSRRPRCRDRARHRLCGWCPHGGWAEDFPAPPGLLARYPKLKETPLADPAQRTEWNVRDADACLIIVDAGGIDVSRGTALARELAHRYRKPLFVADLAGPDILKRHRAVAARAAGPPRRQSETCDRRAARERSAGNLRPRERIHRGLARPLECHSRETADARAPRGQIFQLKTNLFRRPITPSR